jgi:ankyrin repeat protein
LTTPIADSLEELIQALAEHGSELTNPLIAAASVGNVRGVVSLLDLGADIDGNGYWTPLEEALYWVHPASVELLLQRGAAVDNLRKAAGRGRMDVMANCFDDRGGLTDLAGVVAWPFGDNIPQTIRNDRQQIVNNALIYAAAWGQIPAVDELLKRGGEISAIPAGFDFAGTALHYAALEGRREMVEHLLKLGADPTQVDTKVRTTPEHWAQHGGHPELAAYLRSRT